MEIEEENLIILTIFFGEKSPLDRLQGPFQKENTKKIKRNKQKIKFKMKIQTNRGLNYRIQAGIK